MVVFCDASFVNGHCWLGLTCPQAGLRAAKAGGPTATSASAELLAILWAAEWASRRFTNPIIVNDNQGAVAAAAGEGTPCLWSRSTGNQGNLGLIEAHITATAARVEGKAGTWAARTRALKAAGLVRQMALQKRESPEGHPSG